MTLPDPRRYGSGDSPLLQLAADALVSAMRELARGSRDDEMRQALAAAPSHAAYVRIWRALCTAIEKPGSEHAVAPRVFAMPWVIVCSATTNVAIECVVHDLAPLTAVFEKHGVFGAGRSVGFSNALCAIETIEALPPSAVSRWAHGDAPPDARDGERGNALPPAPIRLTRGDEAVHVRFLVGAAVVPAHAPDITETGSNVGAWGTPALQAMAAQLKAPGAQLLPMPRPPAGLYSAAYAGRRQGLEAALNLFFSKTVRTMRLKVGDPSVTLAAHAGGDIRLTLWTALDDSLVEGFRWPLHPLDDIAEIERIVAALAEECRLGEPAVLTDVLPDRTSTGAVLYKAAS